MYYTYIIKILPPEQLTAIFLVLLRTWNQGEVYQTSTEPPPISEAKDGRGTTLSQR